MTADDKPEIEVVAKPTRRRFTAKYKRQVVEEAARCEFGEVAALLRREGLYSSQLAAWRKQYEEGADEALSAKTRGRKPKDPHLKEVEMLRRQNERLQKKLDQAELIIDVQKKVSTLFGIKLTEED